MEIHIPTAFLVLLYHTLGGTQAVGQNPFAQSATSFTP
jgi:hypothetical protein